MGRKFSINKAKDLECKRLSYVANLFFFAAKNFLRVTGSVV